MIKKIKKLFLKTIPFYLLVTLLIVICSSIISTFILYFFGKVFTIENPPEQWWSAIGAVSTISFGVIALAAILIYRENRNQVKLELQDEKIEKIEENNQNLFSLLSNVSNLQAVYDNKSEDLWEKIITSLKSGDFLNLLDNDTLRLWSNMAWKQNHFDAAFEIRKLSFENDKSNLKNRIYYASILMIKDDSNLDEVKDLLRNIDMNGAKKIERNHYYNMLARYNWHRGNFKRAATFYKKGMEYDIWSWSYKGYFLCRLMDKKYSDSNVKKDLRDMKDESKWFDNTLLSQEVFSLFLNAYLYIGKKKAFYDYFSLQSRIRLNNYYNSDFRRIKLTKVYSNLLSKFEKSEDLKYLYLTMYYFIGACDKEADQELKNEGVMETIYKLIKA